MRFTSSVCDPALEVSYMRSYITRDKKIVVLVLYRFVHRFSLKHMSNRFDVGAFIIQKYVNIVYNVPYNKDKFFLASTYTHFLRND